MARRALLVGIDEYDEFTDLTGCVADAVAVQKMIKRNADASPNYSCRLLAYGEGHRDAKVTRRVLREACRELFDYTGDVLLHFSGHGALTEAATSPPAMHRRTIGAFPCKRLFKWRTTQERVTSCSSSTVVIAETPPTRRS